MPKEECALKSIDIEGRNPRISDVYLPLLPRGRIDNVLYRAQTALRDKAMEPDELKHSLGSLMSDQTVVFPSHFFEYSHRQLCLALLEDRRAIFFLQISPGAELQDYFFEIKDLVNKHASIFLGLEIVMDRTPHQGDWQAIGELEKLGLHIRYVFVPIAEFSASKVMEALPKKIFPHLYFYFPEKITKYDSFLTFSEIFLFIRFVESTFPSFQWKTLGHIYQNEKQGTKSLTQEVRNKYRRMPNPELYDSMFPQMGDHYFLRRILKIMANNPVTFPFLLFSFLCMRFPGDPLGTYQHVLYLGKQPIWKVKSLVTHGFWSFRFLVLSLLRGVRHFVRRPFWTVKAAFVSLFWTTRNLAVKIYFGLKQFARNGPAMVLASFWRIHAMCLNIYFSLRQFGRICPSVAYSSFWRIHTMGLKIYSHIRHPIWTLQKRVPWIYFLTFYPIFKLYWFLEFQWNKRTKNLNVEP